MKASSRQTYPEKLEQQHRERERYMLELGFSPEGINTIRRNYPNLHKVKTVREKVELLTELGFKDPIKAMMKLPALITYSERRIRRYIRILEALIARFKLKRLNALKLAENYRNIFCHKEDKLWLIARVFFEHARKKSEVNRKKIATLLTYNLECVLLAGRENEMGNIAEVVYITMEIKDCGEKKSVRRRRILELPKDDPLRKRYLRGYPEK